MFSESAEALTSRFTGSDRNKIGHTHHRKRPYMWRRAKASRKPTRAPFRPDDLENMFDRGWYAKNYRDQSL